MSKDPSIHELLRARFSPCGFVPESVTRDAARSLLEAARWAPSSYNEQPWAFLVATRDDSAAFEQLLGCLVPANQSWAKQAGMLLITVARGRFARNDKPNRHAFHDVGLAVAQLTVQATALGLHVHQMAGFDAELARTRFAIPEGWDAVTAVAIGRRADPSGLSDEIRARDTAPRDRKPLSAIAFTGRFGDAAAL